MERGGSQWRRRGARPIGFGLIGAVPLVGLIAACGGSTAVPAGVRRADTQTSSQTTTTASSSSTPGATPVPPVVMIEQQNGPNINPGYVLQAMDPSGTPLWAVPVASGMSVFTSGPRLFEVDSHLVSVFDRTGHTLGDGDPPSAEGGTQTIGEAVFSPTSAEWAWSTIDGVSPSPAPRNGPTAVSGSFWVAGVGEPAHRAYRWTETDPSGSGSEVFDRLAEWSDRGLVSSRHAPWAGCAEGLQSSSFIVDPASGQRTDLSADAVVDVHAGVIVSAPRGTGKDPQAIVLSGRTSYTWTNSTQPQGYGVEGVHVSPDGDFVAVPLLNTGCAGAQPIAQTAVIGVADHSVHFVPDVLATSWLDDTRLVGETTFLDPNNNNEVDVAGLDGTRSALAHGRCIGVLTPA